MGLLDAVLGNASEVDASEVDAELRPILADSEQVKQAYKEIRDIYAFTQKRLILIDKQGITGRKVEYHSIPYRAITQVKVETAGHFDMDAELKVWISGQEAPVEKELKKDVAAGIQKTLADYMFG
ncbi:PH domain-containing protein [Aestuariibacter sp. AA17]|uniref:PH domain-containing protein n=1 Tax=Fluctibacter corallii TaxID=2984329 RepID=A0ABT3A7K4_9ALTE|nr:PH domain-containing protein [Aestuariibacter sp. AA17]MCV2884673.1 PH domain-containing protein [Aestuariibacter sp. AA17]